MHLSVDISQMEPDHDVRFEFFSFRVLIKFSMIMQLLIIIYEIFKKLYNSDI